MQFEQCDTILVLRMGFSREYSYTLIIASVCFALACVAHVEKDSFLGIFQLYISLNDFDLCLQVHQKTVTFVLRISI